MKKEFIPGKWYKGEANDKYIKFSHLVSKGHYNTIYYTEEVESNGEDLIHKVIDDYWASNRLEKYALDHPVSLEELSTILPQGHPDIQPQGYQIY